MAYGMCGVESRFHDFAGPICPGPRTFVSGGCLVSARRMFSFGNAFYFLTFIGGEISSCPLLQVPALPPEHLFMKPTFASAEYFHVPLARPGVRSCLLRGTRSGSAIVVHAVAVEHVSGGAVLARTNRRTRRWIRFIFNPAGGMLCPTSVLIPVTGSTCSETLSSSSPSDDKAVLTSHPGKLPDSPAAPSTLHEKGIQQ